MKFVFEVIFRKRKQKKSASTFKLKQILEYIFELLSFIVN